MSSYQTTKSADEEQQSFNVTSIGERRPRDATFMWKIATLVMSVVAVAFMISTIAVASDHNGGKDKVVVVNSATPAAPTNLASADPNRCSNVKDWNFFNAQVTQNNLGGVGPDSGAEEIRYSNVANGMDLVLTTDAPYKVNDVVKDYDGVMMSGEGNNGINGKFGQVNVKGNTAVKLTFTLVEEGTNIPADVAPDQTIFFSVYDLDTGKGTEYAQFTTDVDSWSVTETTTAKVKMVKGKLYAEAGRPGNDDDNPTDPLDMIQIQKDSAVWITYKGRNTWGLTFGEKGNTSKKKPGGRNLLFAGRAQGDCPPGPVAPPPGACDKETLGIEGVIQGGGRVCCPDKCGGAAYGCVGKPVTGGTSKDTIDAPYGIVAQKRFCSWGKGNGGLGDDAPPCINKLTKV